MPPSGAAPVETPSEPAPAAPAAAAPDYSFIPAEFLKDGTPDLDAFKAHYAEITKPAEIPDAYEFGLPDDLALPDGIKIELDTKDPILAPLYGELGAFLKDIKAPAAAGKTLGGLIAKYEAAKIQQQLAASKAEYEAMGPQADARIQTVERALETMFPADQVAAVKAMTQSAKAMQVLEKLLSPRGLQSPTPNPTPADEAASSLAARYPKSASR